MKYSPSTMDERSILDASHVIRYSLIDLLVDIIDNGANTISSINHVMLWLSTLLHISTDAMHNRTNKISCDPARDSPSEALLSIADFAVVWFLSGMHPHIIPVANPNIEVTIVCSNIFNDGHPKYDNMIVKTIPTITSIGAIFVRRCDNDLLPPTALPNHVPPTTDSRIVATRKTAITWD